MNLVEKYLTEESFKEGKFTVHVMKRSEGGKTFGEYAIKASGGSLRFTIHEFDDLLKAIEKIKKLN